jgi:two-component system response regulator GlrR
VGTSRSIQRAVEQIAVASRGRFPVWIQGEEGVERDLLARLVHNQSEWVTNGFFGLDAGVVPEALLRRELFGSEPAAIPSLPGEYDGAFARMRGGTVLIDHIEAVPKDVQQTLAAALDSEEYRRVGSSTPLPLECRVIAASAIGVDDLSAESALLPELSERLRLLVIRMPALRERREDIIPLAAHMLSLVRAEYEHEFGQSCEVRSFNRDALERLRAYGWPGNERELREQIRAAVRLARSDELGPEDLLLSWESSENIPAFRDAKRAFEHEYVTRVLRICRGNISRAARIAKKDRKDFYDVMRRNSINPQDFRR